MSSIASTINANNSSETLSSLQMIREELNEAATSGAHGTLRFTHDPNFM